MQKVVMGIVDSPAQAEAVSERLSAAGFSTNDVSMLFADKRGPHDFAFEQRTKAPEGAIYGVILGAALGAFFGISAGVGIVVLPGLGALVACGPVIAALATAMLGVILLGAVGPALTFLGVSAQWERALQGAIILAAVSIDAVRADRFARVSRRAAASV